MRVGTSLMRKPAKLASSSDSVESMNSTGYEPAKKWSTAASKPRNPDDVSVNFCLQSRLTDQPSDAHREPAQRPDLVLDDAVAEPAADHEARARVEPGLERRELARIVLAVGVELERPRR